VQDYLKAKYKKDGFICLVVLFQNDKRVGHFTSFAIFNNGPAYHFDSECLLPYPNIFIELFNNKDIRQNHNDIQGINSNICGPLAVLFLNFLDTFDTSSGLCPMFMFSTKFEDQYNKNNNKINVAQLNQ
jgi:hypothetical protein